MQEEGRREDHIGKLKISVKKLRQYVGNSNERMATNNYKQAKENFAQFESCHWKYLERNKKDFENETEKAVYQGAYVLMDEAEAEAEEAGVNNLIFVQCVQDSPEESLWVRNYPQ